MSVGAIALPNPRCTYPERNAVALSFTINMTLNLASRGKKIRGLPKSVDFDLNGRIEVLKQQISENTKLPLHRLRLSTVDGTVLADGKTLRDYGVGGGTTVWVKDLGPQVGWRTVFIYEYLGPLFIHPLFVYYRKSIYGSSYSLSTVQLVAFVMVMLHFLKREYESIFVHRFSADTMPLRNIFKNSFHYHVLSGFLLAYFVYGPWHATDVISVKKLLSLTGLWLFAEISNAKVHIILRDLRPAGSRKHVIPYGYGFNWVSFPNYFFESLCWFAFALLTNSYAAWLFLFVSSTQMWLWAKKKHARYLKEFPNYPRSRKIYIPFIL
ncbi:enoyl reductase [Schizosaccharomyces japonicus yFS275]|uniref:Enoyl reductase n=1 Tax=Schizosaccharomyces japonicus (strain yFS275 / FY16936) TaxID=402676 RepID=B6K0Z9_SCHJY|nr:enoyl reductase [Schizosaccharomyces japonicus yFS275]EEB07620.2 enoyl reductase [Schizosaccharomyces japonicus yFS275]